MKRVPLLLCFLLLNILGCKQAEPISLTQLQNPVGSENIAYQWGFLALEATAHDTEWFNPRPTVTSRFLGLIFTATFDAWSRYDAAA
ncbi:MAG: haloperoxidase, partial [Bacteroidota bacterium]|nr:haloperoxidase [Bacteroidota bacterium]